jgi:NADPH:quinone reductase-like Zn-dependent oxidoreductase
MGCQVIGYYAAQGIYPKKLSEPRILKLAKQSSVPNNGIKFCIEQVCSLVFQMEAQSLNTSPSVIHNTADHSLSLQHVPVVKPAPAEYLIQVHATTFTAGELDWPEPNALTNPIPGFDLAGTVIKVPDAPPSDNTSYFPPGTRVYGLTSFSRHGNARTVTVATHSELSVIPESLGFNVAASIPLSALTAWQALFDHAGLKSSAKSNAGTRVLVTAASGGVGIWAV